MHSYSLVFLNVHEELISDLLLAQLVVHCNHQPLALASTLPTSIPPSW